MKKPLMIQKVLGGKLDVIKIILPKNTLVSLVSPCNDEDGPEVEIAGYKIADFKQVAYDKQGYEILEEEE